MRAIDCLKKGSWLTGIWRVCDLIKLDFATDEGLVCIHIESSLMRGLKEGELLISSEDFFLPGKNYKKKLFRKFKWDRYNMFDDECSEFEDKMVNRKILSVEMIGKDLILNFEENYKIEILACTLEKEREFFRIFKKGDFDSHMVVES